jgi:hypothetical protein
MRNDNEGEKEGKIIAAKEEEKEEKIGERRRSPTWQCSDRLWAVVIGTENSRKSATSLQGLGCGDLEMRQIRLICE